MSYSRPHPTINLRARVYDMMAGRQAGRRANGRQEGGQTAGRQGRHHIIGRQEASHVGRDTTYRQIDIQTGERLKRDGQTGKQDRRTYRTTTEGRQDSDGNMCKKRKVSVTRKNKGSGSTRFRAPNIPSRPLSAMSRTGTMVFTGHTIKVDGDRALRIHHCL